VHGQTIGLSVSNLNGRSGRREGAFVIAATSLGAYPATRSPTPNSGGRFRHGGRYEWGDLLRARQGRVA